MNSGSVQTLLSIVTNWVPSIEGNRSGIEDIGGCVLCHITGKCVLGTKRNWLHLYRKFSELSPNHYLLHISFEHWLGVWAIETPLKSTDPVIQWHWTSWLTCWLVQTHISRSHVLVSALGSLGWKEHLDLGCSRYIVQPWPQHKTRSFKGKRAKPPNNCVDIEK